MQFELLLQANISEVATESSPLKTKTKPSLSHEEQVLAQELMKCRSIPHYVSVGAPPPELWDLFRETLTNKQDV